MFGTCGSFGESVGQKCQETFRKIDLPKWVVFFHVYRPGGQELTVEAENHRQEASRLRSQVHTLEVGWLSKGE